MKKIYPGWLALGLEHEGKSVNYLDLAISCTGEVERRNIMWHSKLYDKKVELVAKGLKLNKFPDPESKLCPGSNDGARACVQARRSPHTL